MMKNKDPFKAYYLPTDLHRNKAGNKVAGEYLYEVLNKELFSPNNQ